MKSRHKYYKDKLFFKNLDKQQIYVKTVKQSSISISKFTHMKTEKQLGYPTKQFIYRKGTGIGGRGKK